jgi:hypothetical protein
MVGVGVGVSVGGIGVRVCVSVEAGVALGRVVGVAVGGLRPNMPQLLRIRQKTNDIARIFILNLTPILHADG